MRGDHASAHEHGFVDVMSEVGHVGGMTAIFVAIGKKPQEIAGGSQSVFFQDFRARRADAFEETDGRGGSDHATILRAFVRCLPRVEG